MTELLMLFTSLGAIYFLIKWVGSNKIYDLTFSGIFTLAAVLTRYDGWFLFGFMSIAISLISLIKANRKKAESNMILYSVFGLFGVGLWIGWNWLIFGDPLFFLNGPFSAKAQQNLLLKEGRLFTFHNLPLSIHTYSLAIIDNVSLILFILSLIGLLIGFLSKNSIAIKIALLSLLVPILFNIVSLYLGESVINIPQLPPYTWFNIRYGLMALPAIAIGIAFIANKRMIATITIIAVILMQYYLMFATNNIITIQDGVRGSSGYFLDDVGNWLHNHADHGYILVASSSHDALIFVSGIPLNHFITEGTGNYWNTSIKHPTRYATFIIMSDGDIVYQKLHNNPEFKNNYKLIFVGEFSNIYEKKINNK